MIVNDQSGESLCKFRSERINRSDQSTFTLLVARQDYALPVKVKADKRKISKRISDPQLRSEAREKSASATDPHFVI
jgi:hypothetical protein